MKTTEAFSAYFYERAKWVILLLAPIVFISINMFYMNTFASWFIDKTVLPMLSDQLGVDVRTCHVEVDLLASQLRFKDFSVENKNIQGFELFKEIIVIPSAELDISLRLKSRITEPSYQPYV